MILYLVDGINQNMDVEVGVVKKRRSTSGDDGVCDICAALEGTKVGMYDNF